MPYYDAKLDKQELEAAYKALQRREPNARDRLALATVPLAAVQMKQFWKRTISRNKGRVDLFDDVMAEGYLKGLEAIDALKARINGGEQNPIKTATISNYLGTAMCNGARRLDINENYPGQSAETILKDQRERRAELEWMERRLSQHRVRIGKLKVLKAPPAIMEHELEFGEKLQREIDVLSESTWQKSDTKPLATAI